MPYKYRKPKGGKYMPKKGKKKKSVKPPSKSTYKALMKRNPESFSDWTKNKFLMVPFVTSFRFTCSGDGANQFRSSGIQANSAFRPDLITAVQPLFWDQFTTSLAGPWRSYRVERIQVKFDFMDNSTTNEQYYVFAVVGNNSTVAATISTVADLLEGRDFGIRPAYSLVQGGIANTASGRRRLKIEFDVNKPLGFKKAEYQARPNFTALCNASPTDVLQITYGIVNSVTGVALPATCVSNINVRTKQLVKLIGRNDIGGS